MHGSVRLSIGLVPLSGLLLRDLEEERRFHCRMLLLYLLSYDVHGIYKFGQVIKFRKFQFHLEFGM